MAEACLLTPDLRSQFLRSSSSTPTSSSKGCASSYSITSFSRSSSSLLLLLVIASDIVCSITPEDTDGHSHNRGEPDKEQNLQEQQHGEESPLEPRVEANLALVEPQRLQEVETTALAKRWVIRARQILVRARIARSPNNNRGMGPGGVAHEKVQDVPGNDPRDHEDAKHDIAER